MFLLQQGEPKSKVYIKRDPCHLTRYRKGVIIRKVLGDKEISEGINGLLQRLNMLHLMLDDCRALMHQRKDRSLELAKRQINKAKMAAVLITLFACIISAGLSAAFAYTLIHWIYDWYWLITFSKNSNYTLFIYIFDVCRFFLKKKNMCL